MSDLKDDYFPPSLLHEEERAAWDRFMAGLMVGTAGALNSLNREEVVREAGRVADLMVAERRRRVAR